MGVDHPEQAALYEAWKAGDETLRGRVILSFDHAVHVASAISLRTWKAPLNEVKSAVWEEVMKNLHRWEPTKGAATTWVTWLSKRAVRKLAEESSTIRIPTLRRQAGMRVTILSKDHPDDRDKIEENADPALTPSGVLEKAEEDKVLRAALAKLPPSTREAIEAFFGIDRDQESASDIALRKGTSRQNINAKILRGLPKLRASIERSRNESV
jgi:RNA polymerase sigma factor (sigma-70 family)